MITTAQYLNALIAAKQTLSQNIAANGGTVTGTKYDVLAQDVNSIVWGENHFLTGSGTVNKSDDCYPSDFTVTTAFSPARLTVNFPLVLAGSYSDSTDYYMIGRLVLPGISENDGEPQTHTVSLETGTGTAVSVTVTTTVDRTAGDRYELTVSLPQQPVPFVFRGAFDWLCVDAAWEGDAA